MKTLIAVSSFSSVILFAGCVGPMGLPLGLGPGWDELAGIVIVATIVAFAYRLLGKRFSNRFSTANSSTPQNIVRERYARGEITQEEYRQMMQHLSDS
jgi:uncharacterized membrane protein